MSQSLVGTAVGNYRVVGVLGEGGMGTVYRAIHPELDRTVAIKVLALGLSHSDDIVRRFRVEARAVNRIRHPNIVDVQDFGTLPDGRPYYIMEFLPGESLGHYLERVGPLQARDCLVILLPICEALAAAHAAGVVHRDLKPDNIFLLARDGAPPTPKLLDFGIAKVLSETITSDKGRTQSGALMGTPLYMSPEQAGGRVEELGTASDVYSLGVILYQMLSGKTPFESPAFGELLMMHMQEPPPQLSSKVAGVPPAFEALVMRMLAKLPSARPANAAVLRKELQSIADQLALSASGPLEQSPCPPTLAAPAAIARTPYGTTQPSGVAGEVGFRTIPPSKRRRVIASVVIAMLVIGAFALVFSVVHSGGDSKPAADRTERSVPAVAIDAPPPDAAIDAPTDAPWSEIERKLLFIKQLYDEKKIDKEEYDVRKKQILDHM